MNIFTDHNTGADKARVELARKAIAEAGGMAIGADALAQQSEKAELKRREEQNVFRQLTALQSLMQDPAYRAAYERVTTRLNNTQSDLDTAIIENAAEYERLLDNAAKSKDGQAIFRREDGSYVYTDGTEVTKDQLPPRKDMSDQRTSWQEYQKNRMRANELARIQSDILDPIHRRLSDQDTPPKKEELDEFEKDLDEANRDIKQMPVVTPPASAKAQIANLDLGFAPSSSQ